MLIPFLLPSLSLSTGNNSPEVSYVSACFLNKGINYFAPDHFFQGCLYSKQPLETVNASLWGKSKTGLLIAPYKRLGSSILWFLSVCKATHCTCSHHLAFIVSPCRNQNTEKLRRRCYSATTGHCIAVSNQLTCVLYRYP